MNTKNQYIQPDTKVYRITPFKLLDTQSLPERDNEPISEGELDAKEHDFEPETWPSYSVWDD
jgi:hypothetical protein